MGDSLLIAHREGPGAWKRRRAGLSAAIVMCAFALALLCAVLAPDAAYATYKDVREPESSALNYPENGGDYQTNGDVLYVSDIPDGVYEIKAVTNSRMCRFYSSKSGADSGGGESSNPYSQRALLVVEGGAGTAVFYVTTAYSRLYLGTAEDAAAAGAAADPEGLTDSPSYMRSDPEEERVYTIPVGALNSPITFASFNGGRNGVESGTWMTREVIFQTSPEIFQAIDAATNPPAPEDPDPGEGTEDPESGETGDDTEEVDQTEDAGDYSLPPEPEGENPGPDDSGDEDDSGDDGDDDEKGGATPSGSGVPGGTGTGNANSGSGGDNSTANGTPNGAGNGEEDGEDGAAGAKAAKAGTKRGVLIVPSILDLSQGAAPIVMLEPDPEQQVAGLSPMAAALILIAVIACGGAAWRSVSFGMQKRKEPDL